MVDLSATTGVSPLHRAAPAVKLIAFALVVAAVVVQRNLLLVCGVLAVLVAVAAGCRLRLRAVLGLAAYPGLFALVFAFAAAPDPVTGALFVAKAVAAALVAVILMFTTPYPQVFAPLQRVVPEVVGDAMLMTYRSLFLLAEKFDNLLRAVRLRSGLAAGHPVRAARAATSALGALVLYSFDLSQREYDVLRLRGYDGHLRVTVPPSRSRATDAALLLGAGAVLATAAVFRLAGAGLTPYSWLPLFAALLALLTVLAWRSISR
jgi:cobalt/nickel transport system permease protein